MNEVPFFREDPILSILRPAEIQLFCHLQQIKKQHSLHVCDTPRLPWPLSRALMRPPNMNNPAKVGAAGELEFAVEDRHAIAFPNKNMPPVLSTPSLIWFLEHAAIKVLEPLLDEDEASVGTDIELEHLAPTPLMALVKCMARVIHSDGSSVAFQLEAHDEKELIARGFHRRRVIHTASFAKRLQAKTRPVTSQS